MKTCTKDNNLICKVKKNILENALIEKGDTVIAGLSGGADSVCLLYALNMIKDEIGFTLKAAHLNHGIRGEEANRDEFFAKDFAESLGVEFFSAYRDIPSISGGKNMELFARSERYKFFSELSEKEGGAKIAVAHNKNDVAETMVMRLARGASVFGLTGIPVKNNNIIRPLLTVSREEIEEFLETEKQSFVTDSTNLSDDYTRNRIRHKILPEMKAINEGYLTTIGNTASRMASVADFIRCSAAACYGKITSVIDAEKLLPLHDALKEYIISESVYAAGAEEVSEKNISDIKGLLESDSGKRIDIPGGYEALKVYSEIKILRKKVSSEYYKELKIGKNYIKEANYIVEIKKSEKGIDGQKLTFPLVARPRKSGDFIEIKGINGRKKIKSLFVDEKLPLDQRDRYPLILSGDEVVFALGRCGKKFISDEKTKEAYNITITEGECKDVE